MNIKDEMYPSAKVEARLLDDGTLWIKTRERLNNIGRVIVEDGTTWCRVFYQDDNDN